jgi:hypothetical protein
MQVDHIFENHIYLISNQAVAVNGLFRDSDLSVRFLERMEKYLSPICKILHYVIDDDQFQILVKMAVREDFCNYYRHKKQDDELEESKIPLSTHIFSQAMANLQSSAAIHYNRKVGRQGALFARRFRKRLVCSKESLKNWIEKLNAMKKQFSYASNWRYRYRARNRRKWVTEVRERLERSAYVLYQRGDTGHKLLSSFVRYWELELQGQFEILPPKRIFMTNLNKISQKPPP